MGFATTAQWVCTLFMLDDGLDPPHMNSSPLPSAKLGLVGAKWEQSPSLFCGWYTESCFCHFIMCSHHSGCWCVKNLCESEGQISFSSFLFSFWSCFCTNHICWSSTAHAQIPRHLPCLSKSVSFSHANHCVTDLATYGAHKNTVLMPLAPTHKLEGLRHLLCHNRDRPWRTARNRLPESSQPTGIATKWPTHSPATLRHQQFTQKLENKSQPQLGEKLRSIKYVCSHRRLGGEWRHFVSKVQNMPCPSGVLTGALWRLLFQGPVSWTSASF